MPSYTRFSERAEYEAVRPGRLEEVQVEMFLSEFGPLPNDELKYCSNVELRGWWGDYFADTGAADVTITPLRYFGD